MFTMYNQTRMIGELNECLFKLRKPLADFLCKILPPILGEETCEKQIFEELEQNIYHARILKQGNIETIHDLDLSILLNILLSHFSNLRDYYNSMPD